MKKGNDIKKSFSSRRFKMGGFQTLTMVIVIVVVVILNLIVGKMGISVDLSSDRIYTLTEDTKKLASQLSDDITMYYMCQDGNETAQIEKVIEQYDKLAHITVEEKDPVIYPNFSKDYTDEDITDNDVIVVNKKANKSKLVKYSEMLIQDVDYTTYSQTNTLDAEGKLTAAIQNVTSAETKKIYTTSGHEEQALDDAFTDVLSKSNVTTETLETSSKTAVPSDCDILLINGPKYDFSNAEYTMLETYLKEGGKAMIFLNAGTSEETPNFNKLLKTYGVNTSGGYVLDSEKCLNANYPNILKPDVQEHDITTDVGQKEVYIPTAVGMTSEKEVRSTLKTEALLKTSDSAFSRADRQETSMEKVEGDLSGPFNVAMAVTDSYAEKTKGSGYATKLVIFGSYHFASADFAANNQFGNRSMLLRSLSWLSGSETSTLAIPTRSLDEPMVTIKEGNRIFWTVFLVILLPLAFLAVGFVIWYRRRKS